MTSGDLGSSAQTASLLAASKALGQMLRQEDREWFFKADESPYVASFVQVNSINGIPDIVTLLENFKSLVKLECSYCHNVQEVQDDLIGQ